MTEQSAIEILYFDGCPNHERLLTQLQRLLPLQITADIVQHNIPDDHTAQRERFLGSPSIRVNGRDIEPDADQRRDYGLKCRIYHTPTGLAGLPSDEWLLDALTAHTRGTGGRRELPMAIDDCSLDPTALDDQTDRYRRLGAAAATIERSTDSLLITFGPIVDLELLAETIATERSCCPFFALDYDTSRRRLSIRVTDPLRLDALDAILSALRSGGTLAAER